MEIPTDFFRHLIDQMSDGVYFVDRRRRISYWSSGAQRLTGYAAEDVIGRSCREGMLNHVDENGAELCGRRCPLSATMRDGESREAYVFLRHAEGHRLPVWVRSTPLYDEEHRIVGAIEVFNDASSVARMRDKLRELEGQALTDPLTGLGNRRYLDMQLDARVSEWQRYGSPFGVAVADIDGLRHVNDGYGREVGDGVLAMVAHTLVFACRGSDVVARFGGGQFVAILQHTTPDGLVLVGERLRSLVECSSLLIDRKPVTATICVGAVLVEPGDNAVTVVRRAEQALREAKDAGPNRVNAGVAGAVHAPTERPTQRGTERRTGPRPEPSTGDEPSTGEAPAPARQRAPAPRDGRAEAAQAAPAPASPAPSDR